MRYGKGAVLGLLHVLPAVLSGQHIQPAPLNRPARPTSAAITAGDVASRLSMLTADSTRANESEPPGGLTATARIGREMKSIGLMPAGEGGTFFQGVPFVARRLSRESAISVNNVLMTAYADFAVLPFSGSSAGALDGVQAVYGGVYGDTMHVITSAQAAGKLVVIKAPNGLGRLPPNSALQRAAAIAIVGGDALSPDVIARSHRAVYRLKAVKDGVAEPVILVVTRLSATQLVGGPLDGMAVGTVGHVIAANLIYDETPAPARNVVAVLSGRDPALRGEFVTVDARLAANAIGVAAMMEVAEAFARGKTKPRRSLLFILYAGDGEGQLGSRFFTDHPTVSRDSIVAEVNIDVEVRGASPDLPTGGERSLQVVGFRGLSTQLGELIDSVNRGQSKPFAFDHAYGANAHPANLYCRSDHFNYARYGIPGVLMTTGPRDDTSLMKGVPRDLDYQYVARVGQFALDLARRVADLEHKPTLDKPGPDPLAACGE